MGAVGILYNQACLLLVFIVNGCHAGYPLH